MFRRPGMKPDTVLAVHALISGALKQAKRWQLIRYNVADDVTKPAKTPSEPKAPKPAQVRRFLKTVADSDPDFFVYLRLSAASGCRRGEVVGFQWRDVDWVTDKIKVERSVGSTTATGIFVKDTKTHQKHSQPLDPGTMAILAVHRARCEERARFLFSMDLDGSRPWHPDTPTGRFRRARAKIGDEVDEAQLRQFRHYVGTEILDKTKDIKAAQGALRHGSATTTLKFYAAGDEARVRRGSDIIGAQLDEEDDDEAVS